MHLSLPFSVAFERNCGIPLTRRPVFFIHNFRTQHRTRVTVQECKTSGVAVTQERRAVKCCRAWVKTHLIDRCTGYFDHPFLPCPRICPVLRNGVSEHNGVAVTAIFDDFYGFDLARNCIIVWTAECPVTDSITPGLFQIAEIVSVFSGQFYNGFLLSPRGTGMLFPQEGIPIF